MAFKFSTGLRTEQCFVGSLKSILDGSVIRLYAGNVPESPDSELSDNDMLCEITADGNPITFESDSGIPVLTKNLSEVWQGEVVQSGRATFFRVLKESDTDAHSGTQVRVQGTVGGPAADLTISNPDLVEGAPQRIEFFAIELLESS